jgi:integrase/recombinase XerD
MPGDLEPLPAATSAAAPGPGPAALAAELLGRVRAELPAVGGLGEREQVLVAARAPGRRRSRSPRPPVAALEAYLAARAERAGAGEWRQLGGPLLATAAGGRLRQGHLWELVRHLARTAGVGAWEQLSPHSLRHSAITFALDAGASLRDVQDYAGHKDPRTTRRYDHSRDSLDRNAAYTVAAYLA